MSLTHKVVGGWLSLQLLVWGGLNLIWGPHIVEGYESFEQHDLSRDLALARDVLSSRIQALNTHLNDWAAWDVTYAFMQDHDPAYLTENLPSALTLQDLGLHFLTLREPQGKVVYQTAISPDEATPRSVDFPVALEPFYAPGQPLVTLTTPESRANGLLVVDGRIALVVSQPVVTGAHEGPLRGIMSWGRFLTEADQQALAQLTHLNLRVIPLAEAHQDTALTGLVARLENQVSDEPQMLRGEDHITGLSLVRDMTGKTGAVLRVDAARHYYQEGLARLDQFSRLLLLLMLLSMGVGTFLLRRMVLKRLSALSTGLEAIGANGQLSARVSVGGEDELGCLGRTLNRMLEQLQEAQALQVQQEALAQSERQQRAVVEHAPVGVILLDGQALQYLNRAALELMGVPSVGDAQARSLQYFLPDLDEESLMALQRARDLGEESEPTILRSEQRLRTFTGEELQVEVVARALARPFKRGIQLMVQDISQRKEAEARLSYMAYHDPLTGLPNRHLFESHLEQALLRSHRTGERIACIAIDLDRFKNVNDAYGHAVGDALLVLVAQRLRETVRACDLVCRVSGDEFLLLLTDLPSASVARQTAERLIERLRVPCQLQEHELYVTLALGIAVAPEDGKGAHELIRNAETALFRSKGNGGNSLYTFDTALGEARARQRGMEYHLRKALERDELFLVFQPQVDVQTRQVVGAESLLRWQHPELGLVSPGQFIPVAEETGLIVPITEWVMRKVCQQLLDWNSRGLGGLRMAVNISPRHMSLAEGDGLLTLVKQVLADYQIRPDLLELEVTESVAMYNMEASTRLLTALHDLGVMLSIDDFGTGYSSLGYLRRFPIHALKIDQSFIRDLTLNRDSQAIVETILAMSQALGLTAIAEGVEQAEQLHFMQSRGCKVVQGYYFSRPLLPMDFEAFVLKSRQAGSLGPRPPVLVAQTPVLVAQTPVLQ